MNTAVMVVAGLILWVCVIDAIEIWCDRPRPVRAPDGSWRAARRHDRGWGRP